MPCFDGYPDALAQMIQIFGKSPKLKLRNQANLLSRLEQNAVTIGCLANFQLRQVCGTRGRSGEPLATDLRNEVHLSFGALQAFGASSLVLDDPVRESD